MRNSAQLLDDITILRFRDLRDVGVIRNRVTLDRWVKAGKFPQPVRLGENSIGWRLSDVRRWMDERSGGSVA